MLRIRHLLTGCALASATGALAQSYPSSPYPAASYGALTDADQLAQELRVVAADPTNLYALINAGRLSLKVGDTDGAAALYTRADRLAPGNPQVKAGMARLLVNAQRPGEALRLFAEAAQAGANPRDFGADRALAYDLIGEQERAQREYRALLRQGSDDETTRRYALSLGISGLKDPALAVLEPLNRRGDRGAWRARAFVLAMNGERRGAETIATTMMPAGMADGLKPFFDRLPKLAAGERAFAVHFGEVRGNAARYADARRAPPLPALAPEPNPFPPKAAVVLAAAEPTAKKKKKDKRAPAVRLAAAQPYVAPLPPPPAPTATQLAALGATQVSSNAFANAPVSRGVTILPPPPDAYRPAGTQLAANMPDNRRRPGFQAAAPVDDGGDEGPDEVVAAPVAKLAASTTATPLTAAGGSKAAPALAPPPVVAPPVLAAATPVATPSITVPPVATPAPGSIVVAAAAQPASSALVPIAPAEPGFTQSPVQPVPTEQVAVIAQDTVAPSAGSAAIASFSLPPSAAAVAADQTAAPPAATVPGSIANSPVLTAAAPVTSAPLPAAALTAPAMAAAEPTTAPAVLAATVAPAASLGPPPAAEGATGDAVLAAIVAGIKVPPSEQTAGPAPLGEAKLLSTAEKKAETRDAVAAAKVAAEKPALPAKDAHGRFVDAKGKPLLDPRGRPLNERAAAAWLLAHPGQDKPAVKALATVPARDKSGRFVDAKGKPLLDARGRPLTERAAIAWAAAHPAPAGAKETAVALPDKDRRGRFVDTKGTPLLDARGKPLTEKAAAAWLVAQAETGPGKTTGTAALPAKDKRGRFVDAGGKPLLDARGRPLTAKAAAAWQLDQVKRPDARKKADAKAEPGRFWVQVAGGANDSTLAKEWKRVSGSAAALKGRQGWTTPLNATNRVLTGPFATRAEAMAMVNKLKGQGVAAFMFASDPGQKITRLGGN